MSDTGYILKLKRKHKIHLTPMGASFPMSAIHKPCHSLDLSEIYTATPKESTHVSIKEDMLRFYKNIEE